MRWLRSIALPAAGVRPVLLSARVPEALREHHRRQAPERQHAGSLYSDQDLMFCTRHGRANGVTVPHGRLVSPRTQSIEASYMRLAWSGCNLTVPCYPFCSG